MKMMPYSPTDMFGRICSFLATIPFYQVLPLIAIERRVASAIARDQFIYFEDKKGRPVGYASWINLDESEEDEYLADPVGLTNLGNNVLSGQNSEARNTWIMDFAGCNSTARKIVRHLKGKISEEKGQILTYKAVRWRKSRDFPYLAIYKTAKSDRLKSVTASSTPVTRPARLHDIYDLAPRVRWQDVNEVRLIEKRSPFESMVDGLVGSSDCLAAEFRGRCIGICGLSPVPSEDDVATIWLLSEEELQNHVTYKARLAKKFIQTGLRKYRKLQNFIHIDTQNDTMDWLRFLGFQFYEGETLPGRINVKRFELVGNGADYV